MTKSVKNDDGKMENRVMVGTPTRGLCRVEWALARWGAVTPTNWSMVANFKPVHQYAPIGFQIADAQNLIARDAIEGNYEWLILIEDDDIIAPDFFLRMNDYMIDGSIPVVSGLYFTKSDPPEPMIYRGRGNGYYADWKMGDKVWCDGLPTGALLINGKLLRAMWDEAPEYSIGNIITRRIFRHPEKAWFDPEIQGFRTLTGTTDLMWCEDVIKGGFLKKAGFDKVAKKEYPLLVDTNIFVKHINPDGVTYPIGWDFNKGETWTWKKNYPLSESLSEKQ